MTQKTHHTLEPGDYTVFDSKKNAYRVVVSVIVTARKDFYTFKIKQIIETTNFWKDFSSKEKAVANILVQSKEGNTMIHDM